MKPERTIGISFAEPDRFGSGQLLKLRQG